MRKKRGEKRGEIKGVKKRGEKKVVKKKGFHKIGEKAERQRGGGERLTIKEESRKG